MVQLSVVLIALMCVDAMVHAALVLRFGAKGNAPFALFTLVYVVLAILVFKAVPYAVLATFILGLLGLIGLTVTFNAAERDKTLDRAIWVLDLAVVLMAAKLLWLS